jgi:predicted DNA-binding transcriptional regulator YafY
MSKFDNLLLILHLFSSRRSVSLEVIQRECGTSERTAYRYLQSLEAAGYPLWHEKESNGYRLMNKGGHLAHLSPSELSAVYLGVDILESIMNPSPLEVFRRTKLKLSSFITKEVQAELSAMTRSVANTEDSKQLREHLIISFLKAAQLQNQKVRLHHSDGKDSISITELTDPRLQFESEWRLKARGDSASPGIALDDIVDIEFIDE